MARPRGPVPTGSAALDAALGGGVRRGALALVEGEDGAGATEFSLALLRACARDAESSRARFASALRSPARVEREIGLLFPDDKAAASIEALDARPRGALPALLDALEERDVLVIESAGALARAGRDVGACAQQAAEAAAASNAVVVLLSASGSLLATDEAATREAADVALAFRWTGGDAGRRRLLEPRKVRGLSPALGTDRVPVFEVVLERGVGLSATRVQSVM